MPRCLTQISCTCVSTATSLNVFFKESPGLRESGNCRNATRGEYPQNGRQDWGGPGGGGGGLIASRGSAEKSGFRTHPSLPFLSQMTVTALLKLAFSFCSHLKGKKPGGLDRSDEANCKTISCIQIRRGRSEVEGDCGSGTAEGRESTRAAGGRARESLRFAEQRGGGALFFLILALPLMQTDTCQKGLTNARGHYDCPCVRDVRQINHPNHSAHRPFPAPALGSGRPPLPSPLG